MIAFANAQHNAHAAQDDAHVAIQMQGPLSLLVIRALRGALGNILSNREYWVRMGPARYTQFLTPRAVIYSGSVIAVGVITLARAGIPSDPPMTNKH